MRQTFLAIWVVIGVCAAGCGAPEGAASEGSSGAGPDTPEAQGAIAEVKEHLGEATCGSANPEQSWVPSQTQPAIEAYTSGQPGCPGEWVVEDPSVRANEVFEGGLRLSLGSNPLSCLFKWGYVSLYEKQGTTYVKVTESFVLSSFNFLLQSCSALATVTAPRDGDYKIVASSGQLFAPSSTSDVYIYAPGN